MSGNPEAEASSVPSAEAVEKARQKKLKNYGRLHSHVTIIKSAWDQVAEALWKRYPNPQTKHVLSDDIISRESDGMRVVSKRLLRKTNRAPKWMEMFTGGAGSVVGIVEESVVDVSKKTFTTYTRNINFAKLMSVEEKCIYYVCPENKEWTCCKKCAWIKCGVRGLSRAVEKFGVERYRKNAKKVSSASHFC